MYKWHTHYIWFELISETPQKKTSLQGSIPGPEGFRIPFVQSYLCICWLVTPGVSRVKSETAPALCTGRARRDQKKSLCYKFPPLKLCPPGFAKRHVKGSNILSCTPALSASSQASRVVDTCTSFSNLSSPSNFLIWAEPLVGHQCAATCPQQSLAHRPPMCFSHCAAGHCTVPQTSALDQPAFSGCPCTHGIPKHLTYMPPLST